MDGSSEVFTDTFFQVADDINRIHFESGVDWDRITREAKDEMETAHERLYFQIRKTQDTIDEAWKTQDMRKLKAALEKWRLLWQAEVDLWKREKVQ